ncbi:HAD hydrolase family protein [Pseudonocardia phyllosphaerae]|uniref:HAD hydrolase family protein n=1 Tax=Pseudonocardia phyllosphaerae TaxID=3390502 RepID=UPI003978C3ED
MFRPRLVALDIDGTIVHGRAGPTPAVLDAIGRAARHAEVMLCTGRSVFGAADALGQIGLSTGVTLTSNGAVEIDTATREIRRIETFDIADVLARLTELFPGARYAAEHPCVGQRVSDPFPEGLLAGTVTEVGLDHLAAEPTPKLIAHWPGHSPAETRDRAGKLDTSGVTLTLDHELPWLTFVPEGVSKASGLARVAARLGIDAADVLAVGDGDNDSEMLRWAGHGVAMGQAPPEVLAVADSVTRAVTDDGLAHALNRVFG